jgi:hypothetical protein
VLTLEFEYKVYLTRLEHNNTCGTEMCANASLCCESHNATQCYDPTDEVCAEDPRNTGVFVVCPISSSGKAFGVCEGQCFDQDQFVCCMTNGSVQVISISSSGNCVNDGTCDVTPQQQQQVANSNGSSEPSSGASNANQAGEDAMTSSSGSSLKAGFVAIVAIAVVTLWSS